MAKKETWSDRQARLKKKKDFEDTPSVGRKVSQPKVTKPDEVSQTTAHQKKRDADIQKWKKGSRG